MTRFRATILAGAVLATMGATGCKDFLTGGPLSNDPNRPLTVTATQRFVGVQSNIAALELSDLMRIGGLFSQQIQGGNIQYTSVYEYGLDESTTNGFYQSLYIGGGLSDIRDLEAQTRESGDKLFLGIAQVQEAMLVGVGADIFGDIVYKGALGGRANANPPLTPQLEVYDSVQAVLTQAIANLSSTDPKNVGPGTADVVYGGDPAKYIKLAHTLKARYALHTAELPDSIAKYTLAYNEAKLGIQNPSDNYIAVFSGLPLQQNFLYQFDVVQRPGYAVPNQQFVSLLMRRNDPRLTQYFSGVAINGADTTATDFAPALIQPNSSATIVSANENLLIWSEAAYRTGRQAEALQKLNEERAMSGLGPLSGLTGTALLAEILTEKYIATFLTLEPYNDYKRTCFPNLTPTVEDQKIPGRLFYDTSERQTNTSIPNPEDQPFRNANDPANATSIFGGPNDVCQGQ